MIENAHDAGFAMRRHRHGVEAVLVVTLALFNSADDVVRQPLGDKIGNDHRVGVLPVAALHTRDHRRQAGGQIGAAAKTLAEKADCLLDAVIRGQLVANHFAGANSMMKQRRLSASATRISARQNALAHCSLKPPIEPEVSTQTINGPRGCASNS